jgi:hypothetical protein
VDAERNVELLRLGEEDVVIIVAVRFAGRSELHDPSTLVTGLDRPFEFDGSSHWIAQREMGHRNQATAAVRRSIGDPAVISPAHRLRVFDIVGVGFPCEVEAGVDDRGVESLFVETQLRRFRSRSRLFPQ